MRDLKAALTQAQLDASLDELNDVSQAQVNAQCDVALVDYDAATGTEVVDLRGGTATMQQAYDESYGAEKHIHNYERWFGISGDQSGNDWALESSLAPFVATSGAADFGTAIKVLGTTDTPDQADMVKYDPHRIFVTDMNTNTLYILRFIFDCDGDEVANTAEGKGYYTDTPFIAPDTNVNRVGGVAVTIITKQVISGIRLWAKVKNALTAKTLNFYIGIHEYVR